MPRIFISYRNSDSKTISGRIYDRLAAEFGASAIFKDTQDIPPGKDWRGVLREEIGVVDVVLVVIGTGWLDAQDQHGNRRLDKADDWVRFEVETALQRGLHLIPLLVNGATPPPAAQLPDTLRDLAYKQAQVIREDPDFSGDVKKLIEAIHALLEEIQKRDASVKQPPSTRPGCLSSTKWAGISGIVGFLALIVAIITLIVTSNGIPSTLTPTPEPSETEQVVVVTTPSPTFTPSVTTAPPATLAPSPTPTATDAPSATPSATSTQPSIAATANTFTLTFDRNFSGIALCVSTASGGIDLSGLEILLPDAGGSGERYVLGTVFNATGVSTTLSSGDCLCIQRQNLSGLAQCSANNTSPAQRSSGDWINTPITLLWEGQARQIPASCQTDCDVVFEG